MKKWLSLFLLLTVLITAICGPLAALAEEDAAVVSENVDEAVPDADWAGDTGLVVDDGEAPEGTGVAGEPDAVPEEPAEQPPTDAPTDVPAEAPVEMQGEAPELPTIEAPAVYAAEPGGFALNADSISIGIKEKYSGLQAVNVPEGASVAWRSEDANIASVDAQTGLVTGLKAGTTRVFATANGIEVACSVTVAKGPSKVAVSEKKLSMGANGMTLRLNYSFPKGGVSGAMTFASSKPEVVSVSADGMMTTGKPGKATVTVKAYNGKKASCKVTVLPEPAAIAFAEAEVSISVDQTLPLKIRATAADGSATAAGVTLAIDPASPNPGCIRLDSATGSVYGVSKGRAIVTAVSHNGIPAAAPCTVTVAEAPADMLLSAGELLIARKETYKGLRATLVPKEGESAAAAIITWRSDNAKIAKVDPETGAITGVKAGSTTVYAKTHNGIEKSCSVTVAKAPSKIGLEPKNVYVREGGETFQLKPVFPKKSGCSLSYSSSDPSVATVSESGLVTSGQQGTATITATTFNKKTATCRVLVLDKNVELPASVKLAASEITIPFGTSYALNPQILGASGAPIPGAEFACKSSNKKITVDAGGVVKGAKAGSATITVTAYNGVSAECRVTVAKGPSKVVLTPTAPTIGVGQSVQLSVSFPKGGIAGYAFSTSDASVATVSESGVVTGVKQGTATIKVKTGNGKTAKSLVTVGRPPEYLALNADYDLVFDPLTNTYTTIYKKTLNPGETFQLTWENEYQTYGAVAGFESRNPAVASVDGNGLITAHAPGTAMIVVRATGGSETFCQVTVTGALPASIAFVTGDVTVHAGQTAIVPKLRGSNISAADLKNATYSVADTGVATVEFDNADSAWKLRGVRAGSTTLTASAAGATAKLDVIVTGAVGSAEIAFDSSALAMGVGETLQPRVHDEYDVTIQAALASDHPEVVAVDGASLTALAEGTAKITASYNNLTAEMSVTVRANAAKVTLNADAVTLGVGQRFALSAQADGGAAGFGYTSSNEGVATVSNRGVIIARAAGSAKITATAYGGASASCVVTVGPAPTKVSIQPAEVQGRLDEGGAQLSWAFGAPDEIGSVSFSTADSGIATVDDKGYVSFRGVGATTVTIETDNGLTATINVIVLPEISKSATPQYRLFAAYGYFDSNYKGYIPFTRHNAESMEKVFSQSAIDGQGYSTKVIGNPSKTRLLSGIASFFSGASDSDVSVVFLCSHGHMTGANSGYRMSLPGYEDANSSPNYYMSAQEIFNCVNRIHGSVILILDSCYSGAFLEDMKGALDAQGGRISVLTAASDTRATYYNVKDTNKSVDFFTFFLLKGLGYNEKDNRFEGGLSADKAGNNDGSVSVAEFFDFAAKSIAANIPSYMKKSWYWGDKSRVQVPRFYAGKNANVAIYRPR